MMEREAQIKTDNMEKCTCVPAATNVRSPTSVHGFGAEHILSLEEQSWECL